MCLSNRYLRFLFSEDDIFQVFERVSCGRRCERTHARTDPAERVRLQLLPKRVGPPCRSVSSDEKELVFLTDQILKSCIHIYLTDFIRCLPSEIG